MAGHTSNPRDEALEGPGHDGVTADGKGEATSEELVARARRAWVECDGPHAVPEKVWAALSFVPLLCAALEESSKAQAPWSPSDDLERFGRTLSHELRNRINSAEIALQQLELLEGGEGHGRQRELIRRVRTAVQGIVALSDDIRALVSRGSATGETISLARAVRAVSERLRALAEERGVKLVLADALPDLPVDSTRAELVLSNLVTNSINYLDPGKTDRWVRIGARRSTREGAWCVEVADNGRGIPEDHRQQVFDPFFRGGGSGVTGSGLGLSIARDAVAQMGGRLWFESEEREGTTFFFTIPGPRDGG